MSRMVGDFSSGSNLPGHFIQSFQDGLIGRAALREGRPATAVSESAPLPVNFPPMYHPMLHDVSSFDVKPDSIVPGPELPLAFAGLKAASTSFL